VSASKWDTSAARANQISQPARFLVLPLEHIPMMPFTIPVIMTIVMSMEGFVYYICIPCKMDVQLHLVAHVIFVKY
jgi:hypothetical protein